MLSIDIPNEDVAARAAIELARLQGGRRVTGHVERVRPVRPVDAVNPG